MAHQVRVILTGIGHVGRSFVEIIGTQADLLRQRHGLDVVVVAAADSGGAAYAPGGLDLDQLLALKHQHRSVADLPGAGRPGVPAHALVQGADADLLLEATPSNYHSGQPGLDLACTALDRAMHVVLASKAPLVLALRELHALAVMRGVGLRYSGAVGGALPSINVGRRDLAGARIRRVDAVLNGTTQLILSLMARGQSFAEGLAEAQRSGIAEADPALDVQGYDAAAKLVILANAVLHTPATLDDVALQGIEGVNPAAAAAAEQAGGRMSLLASAVARPEGGYDLSVRPTALPPGHPLARLTPDEMGLVYETDIYGRTTVVSAEQGPGPTAAAMLRDLIDIVGP